MKYKVGDKLIYKEYSDDYKECTVVKLLENTNRYRINYTPSWSSNPIETLVIEQKLFVNLNDAIDSEIRDIKKQIELLQSKLAVLNQKKRATTVSQ